MSKYYAKMTTTALRDELDRLEEQLDELEEEDLSSRAGVRALRSVPCGSAGQFFVTAQ